MADMKVCPFCAEEIKAAAIKCRFCMEWLPGYKRESVSGDNVGGDKVGGDKVGRDKIVKLGKELRDEQYEIALNWEAKGKPRMRAFDLSGRDLKKLIFEEADLRKAILSGAELRLADLSSANLRRAELNGANLGSAILDKADLSDAFMIGAKLWDASLRSADLKGASLDGADLTGAKLEDAKYDVLTKWPDGFDPKAAGAILVDDKGNPIKDPE